MEDTDNAHIPKVSTTTWFKPIPERERPATPELEWTVPPNDFPELEHNWANAYATTYKVPEENNLQRKTVNANMTSVRSMASLTGEKLNHLPKTDKTSLHTAVNMWNRVGDLQLGIESYQTKINLERPNWDAADYYFKEDYTTVPKPRTIVYRDRNDQRKLMKLNELHKFSDETLT
ncbi:hypothetical protein Tco_0212873 [Tanacetum coccineum]